MEIKLKDALNMVYQELAQVTVPAEQTFTIGVHVGRALMIVKDVMNGLPDEPEAKPEEPDTQEVDELFDEQPKLELVEEPKDEA